MMLQLLAFFLLVIPFDCTINLECFRSTLEQVAIKLEILDAREIPYSLRDHDFIFELKFLRNRYQELKDAPPLSDARRFPPREVITDFLAFNRRYRSFLENKQKIEFSRAYELFQAIEDTDELYQVWDTIQDANCEYYYVGVRRKALRKLLDELGPEDYYTGKLPPYIPVWLFKVID